MSLRRHTITLAFVAVLLGACGPSVQASIAPAAPTTAPTTAASATAIAASPSPEASSSNAASPSASAACMDKAMFALLMGGKFSTMSPADMAALAQALEAYDFGADATAVKWRDYMVAALKKGDAYNAGLGMMQIVAGQVQVKSCG